MPLPRQVFLRLLRVMGLATRQQLSFRPYLLVGSSRRVAGMRRQHSLGMATVVALCAVFLFGCSSSQTVVSADQGNGLSQVSPSGLTILLLNPLVTREVAGSSTPTDPDLAIRGTIEGTLLRSAAEAFAEAGNEITLPKRFFAEDPSGSDLDVSRSSDQVLRAFPPPEELARFRKIATDNAADAVLVQHCAIKSFSQDVLVRSGPILPQVVKIPLGPKMKYRARGSAPSTYIPEFSGMRETSFSIPGYVTNGFSYIHTEERVVLSAALLSASDGRVLWSNRVILRDGPDGRDVEKAIDTLFKALKPIPPAR